MNTYIMAYLLFIALISLYLIKSIASYLKEKNKIARYTSDINSFRETDTTLLTDKINEVFDDYMILNYQYLENLIITEAEEVKITKEITSLVVDALSPAMLNKISLYYNVSKLSDIISNKVYILVMACSVQKRSNTYQTMDNKRAD